MGRERFKLDDLSWFGLPNLRPLPKHTTGDFNSLNQTLCRWSSNLYTPRVHHSSSQGGKSHSHLTRVTPTPLTQLIVGRIWDFSHNDNSHFWEGYTNKAFTTISLTRTLVWIELEGLKWTWIYEKKECFEF
jgi:hypothetical protein